jgi:hypothetical protein
MKCDCELGPRAPCNRQLGSSLLCLWYECATLQYPAREENPEMNANIVSKYNAIPEEPD